MRSQIPPQAQPHAGHTIATGPPKPPVGSIKDLSEQALAELEQHLKDTAAQTATGETTITGQVNSDGTIAAGTGFTVAHPSLGTFNITFTTPFAATPTIVALAENVGITAHLTAQAAGTCTIRIRAGGSDSDTAFNFVAFATV